MLDEQTLTEIQRIVTIYKGVSIDYVQPTSHFVRIVLRVDDDQSLAQLVRAASGANVPCQVCFRGPSQLDSALANPEDLRFEFQIRMSNEQRSSPNDLQSFGNFLVWDLSHRGLIPLNDAYHLLDAWKGCRDRAAPIDKLPEKP